MSTTAPQEEGQRRRAEAPRVVREKDRSAKLQKLFVGRLRAEALRGSDRGREQSVRASCANDCVSDHCRIVPPRSFVVLQHRPHFLIAQMTMIESVAVFRQRVEELHTGPRAKLEGQGLNTFRSLAFALRTPQDPPSQAISMPSHCACWWQASRLRRGLLLGLCIFEASTLVVASLKEQFSARVELGLIRVQK